MKFLMQEVEKGSYSWGLVSGEHVAGFNYPWSMYSYDCCVYGSIPAVRKSTYFKIENDEVWCFEEIELQNEKHRVKKSTYKLF